MGALVGRTAAGWAGSHRSRAAGGRTAGGSQEGSRPAANSADPGIPKVAAGRLVGHARGGVPVGPGSTAYKGGRLAAARRYLHGECGRNGPPAPRSVGAYLPYVRRQAGAGLGTIRGSIPRAPAAASADGAFAVGRGGSLPYAMPNEAEVISRRRRLVHGRTARLALGLLGKASESPPSGRSHGALAQGTGAGPSVLNPQGKRGGGTATAKAGVGNANCLSPLGGHAAWGGHPMAGRMGPRRPAWVSPLSRGGGRLLGSSIAGRRGSAFGRSGYPCA